MTKMFVVPTENSEISERLVNRHATSIYAVDQVSLIFYEVNTRFSQNLN